MKRRAENVSPIGAVLCLLEAQGLLAPGGARKIWDALGSEILPPTIEEAVEGFRSKLAEVDPPSQGSSQ